MALLLLALPMAGQAQLGFGEPFQTNNFARFYRFSPP
jgi:hypothetical protein